MVQRQPEPEVIIATDSTRGILQPVEAGDLDVALVTLPAAM